MKTEDPLVEASARRLSLLEAGIPQDRVALLVGWWDKPLYKPGEDLFPKQSYEWIKTGVISLKEWREVVEKIRYL